jgi:rod shape-determining protein MreD
MRNLVGLVLLGILAIFQSTIVSRMPLLNGTADLILLFIIAWALQDRVDTVWQWCIFGGIFASIYSALPLGVYLAAYLICAGIARLLKRRIWKAPFLAMLAATFICTLVVQLLALAARLITGVSIPIITSFNLIILPSLLLNLILAFPIFSIVHDIAGWLYPEELKV